MDEPWVIVSGHETSIQAELARARLEAYGIPCLAQTDTGIHGRHKQIRFNWVRVPESCLEVATAVLDEANDYPVDEDELERQALAADD